MSKYIPKLESELISVQRLMHRWNVTYDELLLIIEDGLPVYQRGLTPVLDSQARLSFPHGLKRIYPKSLGAGAHILKDTSKPAIFRSPDVKKFEKEHQELVLERLEPNDARELGRLRSEKKKWDDSIKAAVCIGVFCSQLDHSITKDELWNKIHSEGFKDLPDTTIEKIWRAIPKNYRKAAGRPPKK